jgi:PAS domain S-box-containing protein
MPVYEGLEVIRILTSRDTPPPIIMVTGAGDERTAAEAMKLGASDYLVKDVAGGYLDLLPVVIEQALERHRLAEEKQRAEEALALERQRLAITLESMEDGVLVVDQAGRILLLNRAAETMTGGSSAEAVGQSLNEATGLFGGRTADPFLIPRPEGRPHEVVREEPPRRVLEIQPSPITEGPEAGGTVLLVRDVTHERAVQQELEQQRRMATVGQLAAGVAHEFNNLLMGIVGSTQLLGLRDDLSGPAKEHVRTIEQQALRASELIHQILDFSRQSWAQQRPLSLEPLLQEISQWLARTLPENIRVVWEVEPGDYRVHADAAQIQRILTNLAVNAREAMPQGGELRFRLSLHELRPGEPPPVVNMPPGEWVVLAVSDTGTGMTQAVREHIFEPFYTTKEVGQGAGLGLSQVYGLVKQHRGFIDVESELGQGTTFTLYLPAF